MSHVNSNALGGILCEALNLNPGDVYRIIIDVHASDPAPIPVYVELLGDTKMLSVDWSKGLKGAEIKRE